MKQKQENTKDKLNAILVVLKKVGLEANKPTLTTRLREIPDWDSLKHLEFLMQCEEDFGIEISPEKITDIVTIADIASLLSTK